MRIFLQAAVLMISVGTAAFALETGACKSSATMEEFLSPNMAVFIGNVAQANGKTVYQVSEMLWAEIPGRVLYDRPDRRMYAVKLDSNGKPVEGGCEPEWLPLDHEWITRIRMGFQNNWPANLTVRVRSSSGSAEVAGAEVTVSGMGKEFRGKTGSDGRFEVPSPVPPGKYRVRVVKAGFAAGEETFAVVAGGGGEAEVLLHAAR
ncbi:hypothetical protein F183_A09750 [Bryobacterales bacterium F-183]|nr:hypothetical protein F183_A09750 [Bryobacterales bacterium F-183]